MVKYSEVSGEVSEDHGVWQKVIGEKKPNKDIGKIKVIRIRVRM